jgi:ubiquitin-like 1-activating enzyme E1 A
LIVGLKGLGAEITKNLILAGVKSLTMMDSENAEPEDLQHQFLIAESDIGKNVIHALLS